MINFSFNTCWRLIPTLRIAKTLIFNRLAILSFKYSRKIPVLAQKRPPITLSWRVQCCVQSPIFFITKLYILFKRGCQVHAIFFKTYQITLIWYSHTRPLWVLYIEPVLFLESHKPLSFSLTFIFSLFGVTPFPYRCFPSGELGTPLMASIGWGKIPDYGPPSDGTHLVCKA